MPGAGAALDAPVAFLTLACWVVGGAAVAWGVLRTRDA